jgi:hypothetical protein
MPDVLLAYAFAVLLVAIAFVVAFLIGRAVRGGRLAGLAGLILVAIALLEKTGWSTRSWRPGSPAAVFDDLLFRIIFLVGFGLLVIAWTAAQRNRS